MSIEYTKIHPDYPLYNIVYRGRSYLYSEGRFIELNNDERHGIGYLFQKEASIPNRFQPLIKVSGQAYRKWIQKHNEVIDPYCLTVIPTHNCILNCPYCYNRQYSDRNEKIDLKIVREYTTSIARNCRQKGKPFTVVLAGGGEPTMYWDLLRQVISTIHEVREQIPVECFTYISTNGLHLDNGKLSFLESHVDLIGLSYDGPPEINQKQRGLEHQFRLESLIRKFKEHGLAYELRVTVSPEHFDRQDEIVRHIIGISNCTTIRIEPIYGIQHEEEKILCFAGRFVRGFLVAQETARQHNVEVSFSGLHLSMIRSVYCDILRNTVRIFPERSINYCFLQQPQTMLNAVDIPGQGKRAADLLFKAFVQDSLYTACRECLFEMHCTRGCPDYCFFTSLDKNLMKFRCEITRMLGLAYVKQRLDKAFLK